ncbi:hypothetical protein SGLAM104S_06181 [Streptomyces glaucescens]
MTAVTAPQARPAHSGQPWTTWRPPGSGASASRSRARTCAVKMAGGTSAARGGDGVQVGQPEEQGATVDDDVDEVPVRLVRTAREDASDAHRRCQAKVAYAADML